jgi:hypothetical protein
VGVVQNVKATAQEQAEIPGPAGVPDKKHGVSAGLCCKEKKKIQPHCIKID